MTRQIPRQARAQAKIDFILEASAQVLEQLGEAGFNTNAVAEKAGVSIGTLYRYFPNKAAILRSLAWRETEAHHRTVMEIMTNTDRALPRDRAIIRAFVGAFEGRTQARRLAVIALLSHEDHGQLARRFGFAEHAILDAEGRRLSAIQAFVLGRALHGALRAAVLESAEFLHSREFEDELVRMVRAYLGHPTKRASAA